MVHLNLSRRAVLLLGSLLVAPWLLAVVLGVILVGSDKARAPSTRAAAAPTVSDRTEGGKPGRWGDLEYTQIAIELPEEFVALPSSDEQPVRWFFKGQTEAQVKAVFEAAGLESEILDRLRSAKYESSLEGCWITPGNEVILRLPADARSKIYSILLQFQQNFVQMNPVALRPQWLEERLQESDLPASAISLFRGLLFQRPGSSLLLFADMEVALPQLPDNDQRRQFVKMVSRRLTLLVKLRMTAESNIDELVRYWAVGGRTKDLEPLLESLRRVEGGCRIDIVHLLPRFMRLRLYTYPSTNEDAGTVRQDCFWTAFNVFNEEPDDRFGDLSYAAKVLQQDYYSILSPSQLGDMVLLAAEGGEAIHAATYVADDVVFTKNGATYIQPWILMRLDQMLDLYSVCSPSDRPLKPRFYRRKSL